MSTSGGGGGSSLGNIYVDIGVNKTGFDRGMKDVQKSLSEFNKTAKGIKDLKLNLSFGGLGNTASQLTNIVNGFRNSMSQLRYNPFQEASEGSGQLEVNSNNLITGAVALRSSLQAINEKMATQTKLSNALTTLTGARAKFQEKLDRLTARQEVLKNTPGSAAAKEFINNVSSISRTTSAISSLNTNISQTQSLLASTTVRFTTLGAAMTSLKAIGASMWAAIGGPIGVIIAGLVAVGYAFKVGFGNAVQYESALQRVAKSFGTIGTDKIIKWVKGTNGELNNNAKALGMSETAALSFSATFSTLLKNITTDSDDLADKTMKLLKTAAIITSAEPVKGITMEQTLEKLRSGLLGNYQAIDDLGIEVKIGMLETTKAFEKFSGGKSWQQLTFNQQQQIIYWGILEQAANRYGNTKFSGTANEIAMLKSAWTDLLTHMGRLIKPFVGMFVVGLRYVVKAAATYFGYIADLWEGLFGQSEIFTKWKLIGDSLLKGSGAFRGMADGANELNKELSKTGDNLQGFDELNIISTDSKGGDSSAGASGAGINLDKVELPEITTPEQLPIIEKIKSMWLGLKDSLGSVVKDLIAIWEGLKIAGEYVFQSLKDWWDKWGGDVKNSFSETFNFIVAIVTRALDVMKLGWAMFGPIITSTIKTQWDSILEIIGNGIKLVTNIVGGMADILKGNWTGVLEHTKAIFSALWGIIVGMFGGIFTTIKKPLQLLYDGVVFIFNGMYSSISKVSNAIANIVANALSTIWDWVKRIWDIILITTIKVFNGIYSSIAKVSIAIADIVANALSTIWDWVKRIWDDISTATSNKWNEIKNFITGIWDGLKTQADTLGYEVWNFIKTSWDDIKTATANKWNEIKTSITGVWDTVKTKASEFASGVWKFIDDKWTSIKTTTTEIWDGVKTKVLGAFEGIRDGVGTIWETIGTTIKNSINVIIGLVNGMIKKVNGVSFTLPKIGDFGGGTVGFNIPEIPKLAAGGIVNRPTTALIGEAGAEAVIPLTRNNALTDGIATAVGNAVMGALQFSGGSNNGGGSKEIVINIDGKQMARAILPAMNNENSRVGNMTIIRGY